MEGHAVLDRPHLQTNRLSQLGGQVLPGRVLALDERNLLLAPPALELLFATDGSVHPVKAFGLNQTMQPVVAGKPAELSAAMLTNARH